MNIPVIDGAGELWHGPLQTAIDRWNAALAYRGITLDHQIAPPCQEAIIAPGVITICFNPSEWDGMHAAAGGSVPPMGSGLAWIGGVITFWFTPRSSLPKPPIAIALHELGHALMLDHVGTPGSVMTPQPASTCPTAGDAAGVMAYLPAPPAPPAPVCDDRGDSKKGHAKHHKHHH